MGDDDCNFLVYINDKENSLKGYIAVHRLRKNLPSFGATRVYDYKSEEEAKNDALRLGKLMSYKSVMAGLPYLGAKAVLFKPDKSVDKKKFFASYAKKIQSLKEIFITGADVGVDIEDVAVMRKNSDYIVGLHSDPVRFTSLGVYLSLKASVKEAFGTSDLSQRTVAIQGLGKTGFSLVKRIYDECKQIYAFDVDENVNKKIKNEFPKVEIVRDKDISTLDVDVFSPCAMYHAINKSNIDKIKAKVICGSANNQLEDASIGDMLFKKGILYAPDYVVNAGGLIAVADEYENKNIRIKRVENKVKIIAKNLDIIFAFSKKNKISTNEASNQIALQKIKKLENK